MSARTPSDHGGDDARAGGQAGERLPHRPARGLGRLDAVQRGDGQRRPQPGDEEAAEDVGRVVPAEDEDRVAHADGEGAAEHRRRGPQRRRGHEDRAQGEGHGGGRVPARPRVAGDLLGQPVLEARLGQHVLEHLRGDAGHGQQAGHGQRPPAPSPGERDGDAQQPGARVGQRVAEVGHERDRAVHAGPIEPDEAVQHGGVALVRRRERPARTRPPRSGRRGRRGRRAAGDVRRTAKQSRVGARLNAR